MKPASKLPLVELVLREGNAPGFDSAGRQTAMLIYPHGRTLMRYALLGIALVLFFTWIGAFLVFHVVGALIHLVLIVAVILFVFHLLSGRRSA